MKLFLNTKLWLNANHVPQMVSGLCLYACTVRRWDAVCIPCYAMSLNIPSFRHILCSHSPILWIKIGSMCMDPHSYSFYIKIIAQYDHEMVP